VPPRVRRQPLVVDGHPEHAAHGAEQSQIVGMEVTDPVTTHGHHAQGPPARVERHEDHRADPQPPGGVPRPFGERHVPHQQRHVAVQDASQEGLAGVEPRNGGDVFGRGAPVHRRHPQLAARLLQQVDAPQLGLESGQDRVERGLQCGLQVTGMGNGGRDRSQHVHVPGLARHAGQDRPPF